MDIATWPLLARLCSQGRVFCIEEMSVAKFRKKPVVIEAWCNTEDAPNRSAMPDWRLRPSLSA